MANQTQTQNRPNASKERKLLLGSIFTDAPARVEPEEPAKIVIAGLAEAKPVKDYPDTFFGRAIAVFRGEWKTLFKASLYFVGFTLPFILVLCLARGYFQDYVMGGTYNFMAGIGVGYPGGGDSVAQSVATLYWSVYQPLIMMLGGAMLIGSFAMAGHFYCAKRSYFQDYYTRITKTFWYGFAKYWWKFISVSLFGILIMTAMGTSLLYLLQQQTLGAASAGAYCGVVFSFIFGAPLLALCMVTLSLTASYQLTFAQTIKNAIVICVNCPLTVALTGIVSTVPLLVCIIGDVWAVIAYILMAVCGFNILALCWTALANRGMVKCHARYVDSAAAAKVRYAKQAGAKGGKAPEKKGSKQQAAPSKNNGKSSVVYGDVVKENQPEKKKKPVQQTYQNPKKKKKK